MRICRFDDNRVGLVNGNGIIDVTGVCERLPALRWPLPPGDLLIAHLPELRDEMERLAETGDRLPLSEVTLLSPVANPSKIIGAPVNYMKHWEESRADAGINYGTDVKTIDALGLFLKSTSSLVGPGEGIVADRPDRRTDHEIELAVVIGRMARKVSAADAMEYIAGYTIGLDVVIRGTEDRSYRKSLDTFSVVGPWLVTADEFGEPGDVNLKLQVNGETRQESNTRYLIFNVPRLIEYASAAYTLYPGDIIMTGTPEGVSPIRPGDHVDARIERIGRMDVTVRGA